jgi:putative membrane protein
MPEINHGIKPNEHTFMERKMKLTLRLAMVAIAASSLYFIGSVRAQDTGIGDNPHLRAKTSAASKAPPSVVKLSDKDTNFIQEAASTGVSEVADGKVAEKEGQSAEVKKIGAHMVSDHSRANNELVELGKKKGVSMDLSKGKSRPFDKANFDRQYLATMEADHQTAIKVFEKEASSGDDADLKRWAAKTLPTLKAHLAMVKDAKKKAK